MKNVFQFLFAAGILLISTFSFAQTQESPSRLLLNANGVQESYVHFFINAVGTNLHYGDANSSLADYKKPAAGITIGATCQAGLSKRLSLVSELYFIMKGGKLQEDNPLTDAASVLRMYAFELPVLARLHLGRLHLNAGPSVSYNVHGTQKTDDVLTDLSFQDKPGGYKRFEAGFQVGGGFSFNGKQKTAHLDIRYCHGLTNMSRDAEIYNRSVLVSLTFAKK
jgi:hypothetical protein